VVVKLTGVQTFPSIGEFRNPFDVHVMTAGDAIVIVTVAVTPEPPELVEIYSPIFPAVALSLVVVPGSCPRVADEYGPPLPLGCVV
jgi:hypothetical protein